MKIKYLNRKFWIFRNLLILIIVLSFYSCNNKKEDAYEKTEKFKMEKSSEKNCLDSETLIRDSLNSLDDYIVEIAADKNIKMGETGELRVWIGANEFKRLFNPNMVQDETSIPGSIGQYARITPYAPDFEVNPSEIKCIIIHPSGSEVRFSLTPKKTGELKVSANIELFYSEDCTGASVPKTAKTLSVFVKTDKKSVVKKGLKEIGVVFWDKFLSFWGVLVALLFAFLLFIIRRKLKRRTGFDEKKI